MAGEVLAPISIYVGGASGNAALSTYVPATNTNGAGAIESVAVVASLAADATVPIQFALPGTIPGGTCKLRILSWANATSGVAKVTVSDGNSAVAANIGTATLTAETQVSQTWTTADVIVENKVTMSTTPLANNIFTVKVVFNTSGWTLAATSNWLFLLIWE